MTLYIQDNDVLTIFVSVFSQRWVQR